MSIFRPDSRKPRELSELPIREEPQEFRPEEASSESVDTLNELLSSTVEKGETLANGLREIETGGKIPIEVSNVVGAYYRYFNHRSDYIYYTDFVSVIDEVVKFQTDQTDAIIEELAKGASPEEAEKSVSSSNGLWGDIRDGVGLVTVMVLSRLVNTFNIPGFSALSAEESGSKAWFLADAAIGIALYLMLSGEYNKLEELKNSDDELKPHIEKVQKKGVDRVLEEGGIDPNKIRQSTRIDDAKLIIRYSLDWIKEHHEESLDFDHWIAYADVVTSNQKIQTCLNSNKGIDKIKGASFSNHNPDRLGPSTAHYFFHIHEATVSKYDIVYNSFKDSLSSEGVDLRCLFALLGRTGIEEVKDLAEWLSTILRAAAVDPNNLLAAKINDLYNKFENPAQLLLARLARQLEIFVIDLEKEGYELFSNQTAEAITACLGLEIALHAIRRLYSTLKNQILRVLLELSDRIEFKENYLEIAVHKRRYIHLASSIEFLAENIKRFPNFFSDANTAEISQSIFKETEIPLLKIKDQSFNRGGYLDQVGEYTKEKTNKVVEFLKWPLGRSTNE